MRSWRLHEFEAVTAEDVQGKRLLLYAPVSNKRKKNNLLVYSKPKFQLTIQHSKMDRKTENRKNRRIYRSRRRLLTSSSFPTLPTQFPPSFTSLIPFSPAPRPPFPPPPFLSLKTFVFVKKSLYKVLGRQGRFSDDRCTLYIYIHAQLFGWTYSECVE